MEYNEEIITTSQIDWHDDLGVLAINRKTRIPECVSGYFKKVRVVIFDNEDPNYDESVVEGQIAQEVRDMGCEEDYDLYRHSVLVGYAYIIEYEGDSENPDDDDEFYKYLIDLDGKKYDPATSIISGGMDTRCDFNEEALYAYQTKHTPESVKEYLISKGWVKTHDSTYLEYHKGNTAVFFDDWREDDGPYFACFGTSYDAKYDEDIKALADLKAKLEADMPKVKKYSVPFLRTQWTDVYVEATSPEEAIQKAEAIFNEGHDGDWIEWNDIDCPEYDDVRGVDVEEI